MSLIQRCRLVVVGITAWVAVVATGMAHYPFAGELGPAHAGIAGAVAGMALLPRRMVRWL